MLGNVSNFTKLTSKYRTGVVNDFSIVTKAVFYTMDKKSDKFILDKALPVQINPNSITDDIEVSNNSIWNLLTSSDSEKNNEKRTVQLTLIYDIYDEYNIRTMDGLLASSGKGNLIFSDLSLENKNITTLPEIKELAGNQDKYVLFKWGQIKYFGHIGRVNCTYTAFSRWGEPLKCNADVYIDYTSEYGYLSNFNKGTKGNSKIDLNNVYAQIKTYETASNVANRAALGLTQALR